MPLRVQGRGPEAFWPKGKRVLRSGTARWLKGVLAAGPMPARAVADAATAAGLDVRAVCTAKVFLGVRSIRRGRAWHWELPS